MVCSPVCVILLLRRLIDWRRYSSLLLVRFNSWWWRLYSGFLGLNLLVVSWLLLIICLLLTVTLLLTEGLCLIERLLLICSVIILQVLNCLYFDTLLVQLLLLKIRFSAKFCWRICSNYSWRSVSLVQDNLLDRNFIKLLLITVKIWTRIGVIGLDSLFELTACITIYLTSIYLYGFRCFSGEALEFGRFMIRCDIVEAECFILSLLDKAWIGCFFWSYELIKAGGRVGVYVGLIISLELACNKALTDHGIGFGIGTEHFGK